MSIARSNEDIAENRATIAILKTEQDELVRFSTMLSLTMVRAVSALKIAMMESTPCMPSTRSKSKIGLTLRQKYSKNLKQIKKSHRETFNKRSICI